MPDRDPNSTAELLNDHVVSVAPVRGESSGPLLRWLALAVVVAIVLVVGTSVTGRSEPPVAVVGSPGPNATDLTALAADQISLETSAPSPTVNVDACAEGSFDMQPLLTYADPLYTNPLRLTRPGALALAIEEDRTSGEVIVARSAGDEGGIVDAARVVARFTGYDIQLPRTVTPVAWSAQGDTILVNAGHLDQFEPERNCSDLFLVGTNRSVVTRLTHNRAGEWANASSISPNGGQVARVAGGDLRLIEVDGARAGLALASCFRPEGPVRWSPDGTWLLLVCGTELIVNDLNGQRPHSYGPAGPEFEGSLPRNSVPLAAAWSADGQSVIAVTANDGASQLGPLQIVEIKREDGTPTARVATEASTEWVLGTATMSPDARWVLVQGDGNVPTDTWFPTYAVNTSTGDATKLPWTVIHDSTEPSSVSWLAEPDHFLYEEEQALYEVDLATMTRTEVGAIPASDYTWFESPAFAPATP